MVNPRRAIADTSVFIGLEAARLDAARFADFEWGISAITLGELRLGVLHAQSPEAASRRLSAYQLAQRSKHCPWTGRSLTHGHCSSRGFAQRAGRSRSTTAG